MKKISLVLTAIFFFIACSQHEKNNMFAKRTILEKWLDSVISKADTGYIKPTERSDFTTTEYFIDRDDSSVCQLIKDSLGVIRQIIIAKKDTRTFFAQYYANGQLQADLPLDEFGQYHDTAAYYYEDGVVESRGVYRHGMKNGEWKNYNSRGKLVSAETYDPNGQLIKKEEK
ncbi:MAG TPA: hypothetical protein VGO58_06925 [Chitinophagaceae bacterium]|jgi:hypothetical protein|nr:hypothetical protein [Chitinophagaceae bacterium]